MWWFGYNLLTPVMRGVIWVQNCPPVWGCCKGGFVRNYQQYFVEYYTVILTAAFGRSLQHISLQQFIRVVCPSKHKNDWYRPVLKSYKYKLSSLRFHKLLRAQHYASYESSYDWMIAENMIVHWTITFHKSLRIKFSFSVAMSRSLNIASTRAVNGKVCCFVIIIINISANCYDYLQSKQMSYKQKIEAYTNISVKVWFARITHTHCAYYFPIC